MRSRIWMALACVAIALVAPSMADGARRLITGKEIKDGSITTRDLAKSARPQAGKQGAPGPAGPVGPAGATGPAGSAAAIRTVRVEGVTVSVAPGGFSPTATAACPAGMKLTGGGFIAEPSSNFAVGRSVGSTVAEEWLVNARNEGGFAGQVRAVAYCIGS